MYLTPAQIKGRIKNVAKQNGSDPITNPFYFCDFGNTTSDIPVIPPTGFNKILPVPL